MNNKNEVILNGVKIDRDPWAALRSGLQRLAEIYGSPKSLSYLLNYSEREVRELLGGDFKGFLKNRYNSLQKKVDKYLRYPKGASAELSYFIKDIEGNRLKMLQDMNHLVQNVCSQNSLAKSFGMSKAQMSNFRKCKWELISIEKQKEVYDRLRQPQLEGASDPRGVFLEKMETVLSYEDRAGRFTAFYQLVSNYDVCEKNRPLIPTGDCSKRNPK